MFLEDFDIDVPVGSFVTDDLKSYFLSTTFFKSAFSYCALTSVLVFSVILELEGLS